MLKITLKRGCLIFDFMHLRITIKKILPILGLVAVS